MKVGLQKHQTDEIQKNYIINFINLNMRNTVFFILLFSSLGAFSQNATQPALDKEIEQVAEKVVMLSSENSKLKTEIETLNVKLSTINANIESLTNQVEKNSKMKSEIKTLNSDLSVTNAQIDSLISKTNKNSSVISQTASELGIRIKENIEETESKISRVSESLSKKSLWGIIGLLTAILLFAILYWLLNRKQRTDKSDFINQLSNTKSSIEESLVKEFSKQTELIDSQMQLIEKQKVASETTPSIEPDHSLALKLASEINLMERNISLMDDGTRGLKQLMRSIGKLKDNLAANDYEMPELLGKPFHEGMKVIVANSNPDENLEKGEEIITKILIPQVNFRDKPIQIAQIELSVGY